jgi:hypothetical protein
VKTSKDNRVTGYEKYRREIAWAILREHQAAIAWDPHFIDLVLNHLPNELKFVEMCSSVHRHLGGRTMVTEEELLHPTGNLMLEWLQQEVSWRLMPSLHEDGVSVLYRIVHEAVGDFQPTVRSGAGWITRGFLPFVLLRAKRLLFWASEIHAQEALEAQPVLEDARWTLPRTEFDLRMGLMAALVGSIESKMMWDCLEAVAYQGVSLRDFARRSGIPRTTLTRCNIEPFIARFRKHLVPYFAASPLRVSGEMTTIAKGVAECLSLDEFRALVPRPR